MIVVSDTSVISNLAQVGQLELLKKLYGKLVIPSAVYQELLNANIDSLTALVIDSAEWIQIKSITNVELLNNLNLILDQGEAEAITLAVEIQAKRLIIDERKVWLKIPHSLVFRGKRMKVKDVLKRLQADGWYQIRMRGSHRILAHSHKLGIVVVPGKLSNDIPTGTLSAIWKQAKLGDE